MTKLMGKAVLTTRKIDVATYDIDFAGVVSNIVYIRWMEDMRMAMTRAPHNLPLVSLMGEDEGVAPAITKTEIRYRRPIMLGDDVQCNAWISSLTNRRITGEYEFYTNGKLAAHGKQEGCFINIKTKKFARTPYSWIQIFEDTLVTD